MARFYGEVGFVDSVETSPGVWEEKVVKRQSYFGDVIRNTRRWENGDSVNDNLNISNSISIVADDYAKTHAYEIRYVEWMGARWEVSTVEFKSPRLVLTVGGVYNGPE